MKYQVEHVNFWRKTELFYLNNLTYFSQNEKRYGLKHELFLRSRKDEEIGVQIVEKGV